MKCKYEDKCKNYEPRRAHNPHVDLVCEGDTEDLTCILLSECSQIRFFKKKDKK